MSKSEMIKGLQSLKKRIYLHYQDLWQYEEMLDEVIAAIEVSEDCISKGYLEQEIENQAMTVEKDKEYWRGWNNALDKVVELIEDAPSVVPKARPIEMHLDVTDDVVDRAVEQIRAEGEWIEYRGLWKCSICSETENRATRFCPNCGAKMNGAE